MAGSRPISDAELEVLKVLWKEGPSTVREVHARLGRGKPKRAYTTVLTLLSRLREKGFVSSEKSGVALKFRAAVTRQQLLQRRLSELVDHVCDGTAGPLVQALVGSRRLSAEDVEALRRLVDELDPESPRK